MADDAFVTDIEVRFRDLDPDGHVNNAVYATYAEQARVAFYEAVIGVPLPEAPTVIVNLEIDYRAPIRVGDDVTATLSVPSLGGSSIPMEYELRANGEVAATIETTQVTWDAEAGEAMPIPDDWRDRIAANQGL